MILYVRQLAWLNASPDRAEGDSNRTPLPPRRKSIAVRMPDCAAQHLIEYLFEIGPSKGGEILPHSEIESWQSNTGIDLSAWEARTIRVLSSEYLKQQQTSKAPDCPAPYLPEEAEMEMRHAAALAVRENLRALAQ